MGSRRGRTHLFINQALPAGPKTGRKDRAMGITKNEHRINDLFHELVPSMGKADTVAGEIVRATCRLGYRNWNDGDHIGVGYGKETCNPAARYLLNTEDPAIVKIIDEMWGEISDRVYDAAMEVLLESVLNYLDKHPELKTKENTEDMFDYRNADEDVDDWDDEEEDY